MAKTEEDLSIYIHWPFCERKCPYCDFFSQTIPADENKIIDSYLNDLNFYHDLTSERKIKTLFFGGGTPSLIKTQNLEKIIDHISNLWGFSSSPEISLEANPNSLKAKDLKSAGINRLSLGIQSLNDNFLKFLGRIHDSKTALSAAKEVSKTFSNYNFDFIYALPDQTIESWKKDLDIIKDFAPPHLSLYQLTIEENTPFFKNNIKPLNEDDSLKMYNFTRENLFIPQYEVSNFAKQGFECKHNLTYWHGDDYIGIGKSSHGRLRINNKVFATTHPQNMEELSKEERATEVLLMGLRLTKGINKSRFESITSINFDNFINKKNKKLLEEQNLIEDKKESLKITSQGFTLLNYIIEKLS